MKNQRNSFATTDTWLIVNKQLVKKAISEFTHELILSPRLNIKKNIDNDWSSYELITDHKNISYHFKAKKFYLDHWYIDVNSLKKIKNNKE
ncbi:MAG TPA: hypothetical protein DDY16_05085, partial [Tenacibaculum sp.]|nr:hypothetical protein [Tenacibaculum sp.]